MSIMKKSALSLCIAASLGLSAIPAFAHDAGDWLVRGRIININPSDSNDGITSNGAAVAGTEVGVEDAWALDIDITYMVTDNFGVELLLDTSSQHDIVAKGSTYASLGVSGTIIETRVLPPALLAQYHFMPHGKIQPYVGLGLNFTLFFDDEATDTLKNGVGGVENLDLDSSFGIAAQVGADFMLDDGWFANVDLKYIDIDTTASFDSGALGHVEAEVDINPWVIGVGVGKTF